MVIHNILELGQDQDKPGEKHERSEQHQSCRFPIATTLRGEHKQQYFSLRKACLWLPIGNCTSCQLLQWHDLGHYQDLMTGKNCATQTQLILTNARWICHLFTIVRPLWGFADIFSKHMSLTTTFSTIKSIQYTLQREADQWHCQHYS